MDLIEHIMAPKYIHKICNGNYTRLSREYCVLDYSLQVEVPEYNGPFLQSSLRSFLEKVCKEIISIIAFYCHQNSNNIY